MAFLGTMTRLVFDSLPWAIALYFPIFLLIVAILVSRHRAVERRMLGQCRRPFWREVAQDAIGGVAGGFFGSLILLYLGVTIDPRGFNYLLLCALLLMLFDLRYLCLAYAGGLLSLISLATGVPKLHIPGLLALVAVLHVTESALIFSGGDQRALPVYLKSPTGTVGGYLLQRVWPVPLLALGMMAVSGPREVIYLQAPAWWPLIPMNLAELPARALVFTALPAAAALGYGDLALTSPPRAKAIRTAGLLFGYSLALLGLAVAAARVAPLAWVAAVFAPVGHELVLYAARQVELRGKAAFAQRSDGIVILAVLPGSRADRAGLKPGEVITKVNGQPVSAKAELLARLGESAILVTLTTLPGHGRPEREHEFRGEPNKLGLVLAPDPDEPAQVSMRPWRFIPGRRETL